MFDHNRKTVLGGYFKTNGVIPVNAVWALNHNAIAFLEFRAVFGLLSMIAIREAARSKAPVRYTVEELAMLLGTANASSARRAIGNLKKVGILLEFSPTKILFNFSALEGSEELFRIVNVTKNGLLRKQNRIIPYPRRFLKLIAAESRPAYASVFVMSLFRCLSLKKDNIGTTGRVKVPWLQKVCGVSRSAVQSARRMLIKKGYLEPDATIHQKTLNSSGAYCAFNVDRIGCEKEEEEEKGTFPPPSDVVQKKPPSPKTVLQKKPLNRDINLPTESKNQNLPAPAPSTGFPKKSSGVCKQTPPTITNVLPEDLDSLDRLEALFSDAVQRKLIANTPIARLNFVAAAVRARQVQAAGKGRDAVRIFVGIVRRGLWQVISQVQEEKARIWIIRERGAIDEFAESTTRRASLGKRMGQMVFSPLLLPLPRRENSPFRFQQRQLLNPCRQRLQHTENEPQRRLPCGLFKAFLAATQRLKAQGTEQQQQCGTSAVEHW